MSVLLLVAAACTDSLTKLGYISDFEAWIKKLRDGYKEYKNADWAKAESDFKSYSGGQYIRFKDQFTEAEREKVDNLTGQYYAMLAKYKAKQVKGELKSIVTKAKAMFEEFKKE